MRTMLRTVVLTLVLAAGTAAAEEAGFTVEPGASVRDVLAKQTGQSVTLRLKGGEEIGGKVKLVGNELVHLTQLTGRDFYDAAVRLDAVEAVIVRARTQ